MILNEVSFISMTDNASELRSNCVSLFILISCRKSNKLNYLTLKWILPYGNYGLTCIILDDRYETDIVCGMFTKITANVAKKHLLNRWCGTNFCRDSISIFEYYNFHVVQESCSCDYVVICLCPGTEYRQQVLLDFLICHSFTYVSLQMRFTLNEVQYFTAHSFDIFVCIKVAMHQQLMSKCTKKTRSIRHSIVYPKSGKFPMRLHQWSRSCKNKIHRLLIAPVI